MKSNGMRSSYSRYDRDYRYNYNSNRSSSYRDSRYGYNTRYNYTSEAFDYAHDEVVAPARKRATKKKNKQKFIYSRVKEAAPLSLFKTYGTIAVVFGFVLTMLCMYASNASLRSNLTELQDRLEATQEDNEYLRVSIEDNLDLSKIETEAMKLGLQPPAEYQIVEIEVPKDSYTVQYDSGESDTDEGIWSILKGLFKG